MSSQRSDTSTSSGTEYSARSETRDKSVRFFFYGFCVITAGAMLMTLAELSIKDSLSVVAEPRLRAIKLYALCVGLLLLIDQVLVWCPFSARAVSATRVVSLLIICNTAVFGGFYNLGWNSHSAGAALFASLMVTISYSAKLANLSLVMTTVVGLTGLSLGTDSPGSYPNSIVWSLFTSLLMPLTVVALVNVILEDVFNAHETALATSQRARKKLKLQADTDPLTGCLNRNRLDIEFATVMNRAGERETPIVGLLDLDNFKAVNTSAGHAAGDAVLKAAAQKIRLAFPDASLIRLGGDEFLLLLLADFQQLDVPGIFSDLARATPFDYSNENIWLSLSVGYTVILDNTMSTSTAIAEADLALRQAKRSGKGQAVLYSPGDSMPTAVSEGVTASFNPLLRGSEIKQAIPARNVGSAILEGAINFAFQPVFDCRSNTLVAAEALLRWTLPDGSLVPLEHYLATFTALEFQSPYFRFISEERLSLLGQIRELNPIDVHFNFSVEALLGDQSSSDVTDLVDKFAGSFEGLVIEISEIRFDHLRTQGRSLFDLPNYDWAMGRGAKLALDDFGIGDNNLDRLASYPVDIVKLDKSWVDAMLRDKKYRTVLTKTRELCEELGVEVIAEGVETSEQERALMDLNIPLQQGFLRGKPMTQHAFMALVSEEAKRRAS